MLLRSIQFISAMLSFVKTTALVARNGYNKRFHLLSRTCLMGNMGGMVREAGFLTNLSANKGDELSSCIASVMGGDPGPYPTHEA